MSRAFVFAALAGAAALGAGCGPGPNFLDGSIKESRSLDFDSVQLRYLEDQKGYDLQYLKALEGGGDDDIVAKVAFTEPDGGAKADKKIDLLDDSIAGVVQRNTSGGASDNFPDELERGSVTFHDTPKVGDTVSGEFAATFSNGKTLFGAFETKMKKAAFAE
jgi:hypothetical protein